MDDDEHVHVRERFEDLLRVMLCQRFVEDALDRCEQAKRSIETAQLQLVDAQEYLARTLVTVNQAARLYSMRRR